jgi:hypothetical protein
LLPGTQFHIPPFDFSLPDLRNLLNITGTFSYPARQNFIPYRSLFHCLTWALLNITVAFSYPTLQDFIHYCSYFLFSDSGSLHFDGRYSQFPMLSNNSRRYLSRLFRGHLQLKWMYIGKNYQASYIQHWQVKGSYYGTTTLNGYVWMINGPGDGC